MAIDILAIEARLAAGETLEEAGRPHGISRQQAHYLVGNTGRSRSWRSTAQKLENQELVRQMFASGKTDQQIALDTGIQLKTVAKYRYQLGLYRPHKPPKHSRESAIWCARWWYICFGYTPGAVDWNPGLARRFSDEDRALQFEAFRREFGGPNTGTIQELFGSWSEFIRQTGLTPAPQGSAAHGRWKVGRQLD